MTVSAAPLSDFQLLREHLAGSGDAFAELVHRHVDMVYSAALRQVRDPHLADDVSQAVFLLLWQKADSLNNGTIVAGWLHRATRYCAANALRLRTIRQGHERRAAEMTRRESDSEQATSLEQSELSAALDRAVAKLPAADRAAVILRFFEGRSTEDVAAVLQVTPDAARKRLERAVAKLQQILSRLGVTTATPALATFLAKRCIVSSPPGVAISITKTIAGASAGSTAVATGTASTIAKGALVAMGVKTQSVAAAAILLLLLIGSASVYYATSHRPLAVAPVPVTATVPAVAETIPANVIRVRASIDGRSRLSIRGNTVQWVHLEYDPPGLHGKFQQATLINGKPWTPKWLDVPLANRQCVSDVYTIPDMTLAVAPEKVSVRSVMGRGKVSVVQQPTAANQFTSLVEFDDGVIAGAAEYSADIAFGDMAPAVASGVPHAN